MEAFGENLTLSFSPPIHPIQERKNIVSIGYEPPVICTPEELMEE
jgi:hypothetical protein